MLDTELSYPALKHALDTGEGLVGTVEFFPEEGKYHWMATAAAACGCLLGRALPWGTGAPCAASG